MKLTRKKSCLIIYALFFAIFKPYFLPTNMHIVAQLSRQKSEIFIMN